MKVIYDVYENRDLIRDSYVAIGSFDGIHRGHKKLISSAVETARKHGGKSVVFTFYSHPKEVTNSINAPKLINSLEEKIYLLEKMGVDYLVLQPFNYEFSNMGPEEFVDKILKEFLCTKEVFVGFNFGFGKGRSADVRKLEHLCGKRHIKVREIPPVKVFEKVVSSTGIRNAILSGDLATVNSFLGEPLLISGIVVHGKKLGRQMGIPTANLERNNRSYLPYGIYGGTVVIDGDRPEKEYDVVVNIGRNPTLKPGEKTVEVHILDFAGDIYDKRIFVRIIKH
ncbi:MAG: bifunctional riboflavin kinase/FAD synthetase, partial [Fusobacteriaceae bacterium]